MSSAEEFGRRSCEFAQRFLQTAVVVDDEAYMALDGRDGQSGTIVAPNRRTLVPAGQARTPPLGSGPKHTLNARSVVDSFSVLGVICAVVSPADSAMETMRQADIVVLDWLLRDGDSRFALQLLRDLLAGEADRNSLRLVAIYTGEARLEEIGAAVVDELGEAGLEPKESETKTEVSYRHGRVVIYAKSAVNLAEWLKDRSIAEEDLPKRLIEDFAAMTAGLLPNIVLTSLTAVRECEHKVLDRFRADLDPAFLAHRACLSDPEDAERQIVNHVAEELRGLMDNTVSEESPAGADAVEGWIRYKGDGTVGFMFGDRRLDLEETITLANRGLAASALKNNAFEALSAGFSGNDVAQLDEQLAWIMSFRTVYNAPPPVLWLGSVVTESPHENARHLICMRPRCDCVRLEEETSFLFLPLVEPRKGTEQIVVRLNGTFKRLSIEPDSAGWDRRQFKPPKGNGAVIAARRESDGGFEFTDTCDKRYRWRGELKAEFAQRIAQTFAASLSRVAVDESEWLRRMARSGH